LAAGLRPCTGKTSASPAGGRWCTVPIPQCLAAILSALPHGNPDARAPAPGPADRQSLRISLPRMRDLDRIQDGPVL